MLREIARVRQRENEGYKRWFTDEYWDLYIWYDSNGAITSFQLCYGKPNDERALSWHEKRGFRHTKVSDGESSAVTHMTPILAKDGLFERELISDRFMKESQLIDRGVSAFVYKKLLTVDDSLLS